MSIPLVSSTLWQPAAAAHRNIVPRLPGSRMLSHIRDKGIEWPLLGKSIRNGSGRENIAAEKRSKSATMQRVPVLHYEPQRSAWPSPITPCGATRLDQILMSSNLTLISVALFSLSTGSSRSRSTVLKNTICGLAPASRASHIKRLPSRRILPWCSRNVLERATLTTLLGWCDRKVKVD